MTQPRRAVFLDRDGTLNAPVVREGLPFPPATLDEFVLLEGVGPGCRRLKAAGFLLVVVTNQPDVGRGTQRQETVEAMHEHLRSLLPELDGVEVCYDPGGSVPPHPRRKPAPGMLQDAAARLGVDLTRSWMIGDRWRDVDCGHAAGCRTVFIDAGYDEPLRMQPHFTATDFPSAVQVVLTHS
jgi:D-glycero-D-manno-heptose 1,7-bisphosphate phosphatase